MLKFLPLIASLLAAGLVWLLAGHVVHPHPICALTLLVSGWIGYSVGRERRIPVSLISGTLGLAGGMSIHVWQHIAESRFHPFSDFLHHALADAGIGILVGGTALAAAIIVAERVRAAAKSYAR